MNTNTMDSLGLGVEQATHWLDQIQGWSAAALVMGCCIVVGYALRFIKQFPNDGIPLAVILTGGLCMMLLADPRPSSVSMRIWTTRNLIVGLIIGFAAWMGHKLIISKIENFLMQKSDAIAKLLGAKTGNTDFIKNPNPPTPPQPIEPPKP